jgi:Chaperone of endosialidase
MFEPIHHKTATLPIRNSISRSPLRRDVLLIPLALAWFALSPLALAVTPAPDGVYPGNNTAEGDHALFSRTTAGNNTATGFFALQADTTGNANTATGFEALFFNTIGKFNTATGANALLRNTTGDNNTAEGTNALLFNTTGGDNTAAGFEALFSNTSGGDNTANGFAALFSNTTGISNTANGVNTLEFNTVGNSNTANGVNALNSNTTGSLNTANGANTLFHNTTGTGNIALGASAGVNTTGNNNIDIGNGGSAGESNTIRIGTVGTQTDTLIAGISGVTVAGGVGVIIDTTGHLGTTTSSERFKDEIKPMDKASEAILALKPVTFRYKHELDPDGIPQFGLVAEQVEKVNPDLVARDADGKINTVRYEAVNAMLLNEFLKEHRKVEEQQKEIAALAAQLKGQAALIRKVSDRLELSKAAPQMVLNNQ